MKKTFSISISEQGRPLVPGNDGNAVIAFSVTNSRPHPARARLTVVPKGTASGDWLKMEGEPERDFGPNESQQGKVTVSLPSATPQGTYQFRIDVADVSNPQENFSEGELVDVNWNPPPVPQSGMLKWIVAAAVIATLVTAVAVILLLRPSKVVLPTELVGLGKSDAMSKLTELGVTSEPTIEYVFDPDQNAEAVVSFKPAAGESVKADAPITLRLNLPEVVGKSLAEAKTVIEEKGFEVETHLGFDPEMELGDVLAVSNGTTEKHISITSNAYTIVPNILGFKFDEASSKLTDIEIQTTEQEDEDKAANIILQTDPLPGDKLGHGRALVVTVNSNTPPPEESAAEVVRKCYDAISSDNWSILYESVSPRLQNRIGANALVHIAFGEPNEQRTREQTYTVTRPVPIQRQVKGKDDKTETITETRYVLEERTRPYTYGYYSASGIGQSIVHRNAVDFFAAHGASHLDEDTLKRQMAQHRGSFFDSKWAMEQFVDIEDKKSFFTDALASIRENSGRDYLLNNQTLILPIIPNPVNVEMGSGKNGIVAQWLHTDSRSAVYLRLAKNGGEWRIFEADYGWRLERPYPAVGGTVVVPHAVVAPGAEQAPAPEPAPAPAPAPAAPAERGGV